MIRVFLIFLFFTILGLFIQGTLLPAVYPWFVTPDIILILILVIGLYVRNLRGLLAAFVLGVITDFANAQYVGPHAAGAIIAYWVVIIISQKVYVEHFLGLIVLGFVASFAKLVTYTSLIAIYQGIDLPFLTGVKTVLLEALITALLTPVFVFFVHLLDNKHRPFFSNKPRSIRMY